MKMPKHAGAPSMQDATFPYILKRNMDISADAHSGIFA